MRERGNAKMNTIIATRRWLARAHRKAGRLIGDRRGVAAVEFALIAPVLLALYLVTMEVSQGIEANKKVGRVASMVADLVTQQQDMKRSELEAIMKIGNAIMYPYGRTIPTIEVTGIWIPDENDPKPIVRWSRKAVANQFSTGLPENTLVEVPETLKIRGTFLVHVSAALDYRPVVTWAADEKASLGLAAAFDKIAMKESYYLRPRMTTKITCTDC